VTTRARARRVRGLGPGLAWAARATAIRAAGAAYRARATVGVMVLSEWVAKSAEKISIRR
jgi:hypothetical protein